MCCGKAAHDFEKNFGTVERKFEQDAKGPQPRGVACFKREEKAVRFPIVPLNLDNFLISSIRSQILPYFKLLMASINLQSA